MAFERQAQRMQAAEAEKQHACSSGAAQECSELTTKSESEGNLYRTLQDRYRLCQQRSMTAFPYGGYGYGNYSGGLLFDPLAMDLDYQ